MPTYDDSISRDGSDDPLLPVPVAAQVIAELPKSSAVLSLARTVRMAAGTQRLPVLSVLPQAYWVSGDTGLKQTGTVDWKNVSLTAEEIAVIIPIPDAYAADSQVPIWDEVMPLVTQAIGTVFDAACLFGTNKPTSFPALGVYGHAIAAGNVLVAGASSTDLLQNVASMGTLLANDGYALGGFVAGPGFGWRLAHLRTASDKTPVYQQDVQGGLGRTIYGFPVREVANGAWDSTEAALIAGDWSKAIVGLRQDITFTRHTDGVITDTEGKVLFNAMQQDSTLYRCVFRAAFALANPVTSMNATEGTRSPFAVIQETTANS